MSDYTPPPFSPPAIDYTNTPADTAAISGATMQQQLGAAIFNEFNPGVSQGSDDSAGGVSSVASPGNGILHTTVVPSSRASYYFNIAHQLAFPGTGVQGRISFNKPMWVSWRFAFFAGPSTNGVFSQTIGNSAGHGPLGAKGFGFSVVYKSASTASVLLLTYDSSLHTSAEVAVIDTTDGGLIEHQVMICSDGAGNVTIFVDGVSCLTVATGPTSAGGTAYLNNDLTNGADLVDDYVFFGPIRTVLKKN